MGTVVLFNHPGKEHVEHRDGARYAWNTGYHRRKYLSVRAHVALADGNSFRQEATARRVALWGEFEPDTVGHDFGAPAGWGLPKSWHTLVPIGTAPEGGANTDPWIFGATFRYTYCWQTGKATAYLRNLVHGDLLLFGSYLARDRLEPHEKIYDFYLDTVFVVNEAFRPSVKDGRPRAMYDPVHMRATYNRLPPENRDLCTFYTGTMLEDRRSRLPFSFSPCATADGEIPRRTARPLVSDLLSWTTRNPQVFKRFERDTAEVWRTVAERCVHDGNALAVRVEDATLDSTAKEGGTRLGACC